MNLSDLQSQIFGLAGVFQASALVKQLARTCRIENDPFKASVQSILVLKPKQTLDIFSEPHLFHLGLKTLIDHFTYNPTPKDAEVARYAFSLLHLERKLSRDAKMLRTLHQGIEKAQQQAAHFSIAHANVEANLAALYTDTLSTFRFRIQILGEPCYLNQLSILNKIRTLLLAGIRSAVLWHQMGGRQWQLLLCRKKILHTAKICLEAFPAPL